MKFKKNKNLKSIAIVGPTATGKSALAVRIAKKCNGEVVSVDSRQIYIGLDIGSGKITPRETRGVPHHMLSIVSPKRTISVSQYQKKGLAIIKAIHAKGKVPILCGGTGLYIQALADGMIFPEVKPNAKLRKLLLKKNVQELAFLLKKLDLRRWKEIDRQNPRRLVRAIEIASALGKVPRPITNKVPFDTLRIGILLDEKSLKNSIHKRTLLRLKKGMIAEARTLLNNGVSPERMNSFGLEYRLLAKHVAGEISKKELIERIELEDFRYAKRQMTWFKRDTRITWYHPNESNIIIEEIKNFLK